ncbi:cytochrome c peroxidase [Azospirillum sp. OGB3]|uniref:DUF1924 domain-containing protein n=1 Tax=Azospirillum sp. OGB3 TaxID=2587012 RepID=UPI001605DF33|nr:DUF1924 domain-containing protein [Azospirillum sp. OGB3]MBB3267114.1 cytochrome c peroxidase [Azospirillum sp. OGB3]
MIRFLLPTLAVFAVGGAIAATANPARTALLDGYAAQAKAQSPAFAGFSAERGRALYLGPHSGGKPETNACAACHTPDPAAQGRHQRTGRGIEPMAVSANPKRFTDPAEVEKRFDRDCPNVLGRACTAQEKGDFITYLAGQ